MLNDFRFSPRLSSALSARSQFPVQLQFFLLEPQQGGHVVSPLGVHDAADDFASPLAQLHAMSQGFQGPLQKLRRERIVMGVDKVSHTLIVLVTKLYGSVRMSILIQAL